MIPPPGSPASSFRRLRFPDRIPYGSLQILPQLPEDYHPISAYAADRLGLDYLALGYWHKPQFYAKRTAIRERTNLCGFRIYRSVNPPAGRGTPLMAMRYASPTRAGADVPWKSLLRVRVPNEKLDIGHSRWGAEQVDVTVDAGATDQVFRQPAA